MEKEYKVVFGLEPLKQDKSIINVENEEEFIEWYFKNKNVLTQAKIKFETKLEHITLDSINSLYQFLKFYQKTKKECDNYMLKYNEKLLKVKEHPEISKALNELVRMNDGGKFLRASLIALGYKTAGKKDNKYLSLAIALEIFQTSILIHDDIIDNDVIRRGKPTIPEAYKNYYSKPLKTNKEFKEKLNNIGNSMAICIGDLGFYIANGIIIDAYKNEENLGKILEYYNEMVIKTCKGEMLDVILPFTEYYFSHDKNLNKKIMEIYKLKTAWYTVIGPFCLGLILSGTSKEQIKRLEKILLSAGTAFQIKDDLLGIYGNQKLTGKPNTSDAEEFKQTILYSYVMKTKYKDELLKYYGKKNLTEKEIKKIINIFDDSGAKAYSKKIMNDLFQESLNAIEKEDINKKYKDILKGFIIYLRHRSK